MRVPQAHSDALFSYAFVSSETRHPFTPVQDSFLAALDLVAGYVHETHPGFLAQFLHALAVLELIEAHCDEGLTLCLQPAQSAGRR